MLSANQNREIFSCIQEMMYNRELKHAAFLSHERQPEVNISHARTMVFPRFSN